MLKVGGSKDKYLGNTTCDLTSKRNAEKEKFVIVKDNKENIFRVTKQMCTENQDVIRKEYMSW